MKSIISKLSYLSLALLLSLTACVDDEEPTGRRELLIGTWEIQSGELVDYSVRVSGADINRSQIQSVAPFFSGAGVNVDELDQALEDAASVVFPAGTTVSFAENNDYTLSSSDGTDTGTWSLSDNEEIISLDVANELNLNQLNLAIESLTSQQITLLFSLDQDDINLDELDLGELDGLVDGFTIQYRFSFAKQ